MSELGTHGYKISLNWAARGSEAHRIVPGPVPWLRLSTSKDMVSPHHWYRLCLFTLIAATAVPASDQMNLATYQRNARLVDSLAIWLKAKQGGHTVTTLIVMPSQLIVSHLDGTTVVSDTP